MVRHSTLSRLLPQAALWLVCGGVLAGCGGGSANGSATQAAATAAATAQPAATTPTAPVVPPAASPNQKAVALKWQPPVANADGSALTPLSGYRVLYGRTEDNLDQSVTIMDGSVIECAIEALEPGLWYFAVVTQGADGIEGPMSNIVWKFVA